MRALWFRLRALFDRYRLDTELDREIADHVARETRANVARGMSPKEARRVALAAFGGTQRYKEEARDAHGMRWAEEAVQDARYALRSLRRTPGFGVVAVLTLALGVGASTAMFTVVNGVLLRPLALREPQRLLLIDYSGPIGAPLHEPRIRDFNYVRFRDATRTFESVTSFGRSSMTLTGAGEPVRLQAADVTFEFFKVLGVPPALGRGFTADDEANGGAHVVVLGDRLWHDRFAGDRGIVGRSIALDGTPYVVVGVAPPGFDFPGTRELWVPMEVRLGRHLSWMRPAVGRLAPGTSPAQAQAELESLAASFVSDPGDRDRYLARVLPVSEILVGTVTRSLLLFSGAVAFVLIIACANVANLMLTRAASRTHEMAVRVTLGAGGGRIVRQMLTESASLAVIGTTAGIPLAVVGVRTLLALAPPGLIPRVDEIHVDGTVLAFTIGLSLITGLAFGLAPALQVKRRALGQAMGHGSRIARGGQIGRNLLVVSEIALSLMLLTGAGLLIRSFLRLRAVDLGFRPSNVVTMTVDLPPAKYATPDRMRTFHARTLDALSRIPGVAAAGAVNWRPLDDPLMQGTFSVEGQAQPKWLVVKPSVSANYFATMDIPLVAGRAFAVGDDEKSPGVAIVSKSVAHNLWPGQNAIGRRISMADQPTATDWITVVGVVGDIRQQTNEPLARAIYLPVSQTTSAFFLSHMSFAVRTSGDASAAMRSMREALRSVDPDLPPQGLRALTSAVAASRSEPLFHARLLAAFSLLALALAGVGVYGVLSYAVTERTREIGIRMALGAEAGQVRRMIVGRTLMLAGAGVLIGGLGALAATRVLSRFLYDVTATDPVTFLTAAVALPVVAIVAGLIPARRASRVDPMVALKAE